MLVFDFKVQNSFTCEPVWRKFESSLGNGAIIAQSLPHNAKQLKWQIKLVFRGLAQKSEVDRLNSFLDTVGTFDPFLWTPPNTPQGIYLVDSINIEFTGTQINFSDGKWRYNLSLKQTY
jgi:phage-related protein